MAENPFQINPGPGNPNAHPHQPGFTGPGPVGAVPGAPPNPYDLGAAFNRYYGGMPTHQVVSNMQQGIAPAQQSSASTTAASSPSPEQAGQMNAVAPGTFNGNPANGVPSAEEGFIKPAVEPPGGKPPAAPRPGAPPVPQPPAGAPLKAGGQSAPQGGYAGVTPPPLTFNPGNFPALPPVNVPPHEPPPIGQPPVAGGQIGGGLPLEPPPGAIPPAPEPPPPGAAPPTAPFDPGSFAQQWNRYGFPGVQIGQLPPPDASNPQTIAGTVDAISAIQNPQLRAIALHAAKIQKQLDDWGNNTSIPTAQRIEQQEKLKFLTDALQNGYGITLDFGGGAGGGGGGGTDGTTTPPSAAGIEGFLNEIKKLQTMGKDVPQWMVEFAERWAQNESANQRYDAANQTVDSAVDQFGDSDLANASRSTALDLLQNPGYGDDFWQTLKNKGAADSNATLKANLDKLSSSFGRRGIGAAGAQGITSDVYQQHAGDLASRMGDLDIARAQDDLNQKYRGLGAAGDVSQLFDLQQMNARLAQAGIQLGAPQAAIPGLEGWGDSWLGQQTLELQQRAQDHAEDFTLEDAAGMVAGIAGGLAGGIGMAAGAAMI